VALFCATADLTVHQEETMSCHAVVAGAEEESPANPLATPRGGTKVFIIQDLTTSVPNILEMRFGALLAIQRFRRTRNALMAFPIQGVYLVRIIITRSGKEQGAMQTTRWQPFADMQPELNRLRQEMERVFGRYETANGGAPQYPLLNLWEDGDNLLVEAELPGMELGDLEIFINGGSQLSINGQRRPPEASQGMWHRRERGYGAFTRVVDLPWHVNADAVRAEFKNGVLTIKLPKCEAAKPRRIEVKAE
jgi:HSP20 family protein